jgi:Pycsar effector protein
MTFVHTQGMDDPRLRYAQILLNEAREELGKADNKVSVLLASAGVISSIVAGGIAAGSWSPALLPPGLQIIWWLGITSGLSGIIVLASALAPRMSHSGQASTMRYFGHAARLGSPEEILNALCEIGDHLLERVADQLLITSKLVVLKYNLIRLALASFGMATLLLVISAAL